MAAPFIRTSVPGVYRRGGRYVVMYRDAGGRQRKRSTATLAEARLIKSEVETDLARGEYREQSRVRFDEYAREWARTYRGRTSRGIRPNTLAEYAEDLELHVIPVLGQRRLSEIEPRHIKALAADLADGGRAPSTVRNVIAPVRALFATAVEEGIIRSNPCTGLRLAGGSNHVRRALTEDELTSLLAETPQQWRLVVRFLAQTGLRAGELIALRWEDINLDTRRVSVRRRIYKGTVDAPKSRFGLREIPISAVLAAQLSVHRKESPFRLEGNLVFASREGTPLSPGNLLRRVVKPAGQRAGLDSVGLHTLRHTCASLLFRAGWNAKQVQMMLGHHSPAFTLGTYVHLIPDDLPEPFFRDDAV